MCVAGKPEEVSHESAQREDEEIANLHTCFGWLHGRKLLFSDSGDAIQFRAEFVL